MVFNIITPACNAGVRLSETLASLVGKTCFQVETVFIDDEATDKIGLIIDALAVRSLPVADCASCMVLMILIALGGGFVFLVFASIISVVYFFLLPPTALSSAFSAARRLLGSRVTVVFRLSVSVSNPSLRKVRPS